MRLGPFWKVVRQAVEGFARAAWEEIGPREHAILAVVVGVYLLVKALWPPGALGVALVVGGGVQLGVILWTQGKELDVKRRDAQP